MPNSLSELHTLHAWEDNQITELCTQGEYAGKVLQFKLVDKDGTINLSNCLVQYAVTRPDKTEDLLDCTVDNGVVKCNLTYSVTSISGLVHGEVRVIGSNNSGTIKFYGVNLRVYKGVSDEAVEQSDEFTALIAALQKVVSITPDPDSENTYVVRLDDSIVQNGLNPVASGVLYDYLQGNYRQISFAHENNESSYDDGGVYIDDATDIMKMYYVKNSYGARVGILFCVQTPGHNYASQVKMDADGNITVRVKTKESGEANYTWKSWSPIENTDNKISAITASNKTSEQYYPSIKAVADYAENNYISKTPGSVKTANIENNAVDETKLSAALRTDIKLKSNQYQSSQSKNTVYSQQGTTWYTGSNRLVYPTLFTQGKTISQIQLYLFVGQATDSVVRFDFWQGFPNHYSIVKTFRFDIPAKSGEGWRFFNIDYVCAAATRISVFVESGSVKFQISQNTPQEQGCYVTTNSTDDNITISSFGNLNAATSIGGSVAVIDSDAFPTCKVLNSGNYGTLLPYSSTTNLPSLDDVKVNVAYAIVKNSPGMNITGYPKTGFLGAQNFFVSIVQTPGSHTSGDLQIMRDRNNVTITRTWSGTAWTDWIFSPRTLVLTASNYRQYLPTVWVEAENRYVGTLDDITENSNIVISYTPTQPAGDPMTIISYPASGFNGAQNLLSTYVHVAGTHTVADLQILRNRNNETATRTWTGSEWSAWVYSPKSPSELNITVDSNLGFAAALKQANNSTAQNVTITVKAGTYDLAVELAEYFANLGSSDPITECVINRDCKIIFESGAEVVCNYTGNNTRVKQQFSIITTKAGSLTLINAKLIGSNIRYCVHDDHESNVNPYTNYYENCNMYLDNSADLSTGVFQFTNCIGNGLGIHGYIEVNGGVFISVPRPAADTRNGAKAALRFHNAGSSNTSALSHIVVKNAYLSSTVGAFSNGSSPLVTPVEVSGCRMVSTPVEGMSTGATIINMSVRAWNNEISN